MSAQAPVYEEVLNRIEEGVNRLENTLSYAPNYDYRIDFKAIEERMDAMQKTLELEASSRMITTGPVKFVTAIDRTGSSGYPATCMHTSLNNTVLLTRVKDAQPFYGSPKHSYQIMVDVEKFEGSRYRSFTGYIEFKTRGMLNERQRAQQITNNLSVRLMASISPNGEYCALNNTVYKLPGQSEFDIAQIGTVPETIAALSDKLAWVYRMVSTGGPQGRTVVQLVAYTLPGLQELPAKTIPLTNVYPSGAPMVCCNPSTGQLVMVHDRDDNSSSRSSTMSIAQPGVTPVVHELRYRIQYIEHFPDHRSVYAMQQGPQLGELHGVLASSRRHIFVLDKACNIHVYSWDGQERHSISATSMGLRTGQKVLGIGYSDEFKEPILRLLTSDNKYIILKVEL